MPLMTDVEAGTVIDDVYAGLTGHVIVKDIERRPENVDYTYGELTCRGGAALISKVSLGGDDVLYDLGCGIGKFVIQAFLSSRVRKAVGIEFEPQRFTAAATAKSRLMTTHKSAAFAGRELEFRQADFLTCDLSDATVVYVCSTCMSEATLSTLATKLSAAYGLRTIISLKHSSAFSKLLSDVTQMTVATTWNPSTAAYVYSKPDPSKKQQVLRGGRRKTIRKSRKVTRRKTPKSRKNKISRKKLKTKRKS